MTSINSSSTFQKKIDGTAEVTLTSDGIILVDWNKNISEIEIEHIEKTLSIIKEICQDKKYPVFITTIDFLHISHDALRYAVSKEAQQYSLANAVLIDNMAKTLVFNFFMKTIPPATPTRAFDKMSDGMNWLREMKKEYERKEIKNG